MWAIFNSTFEPVGLVEASHASVTDGFLFSLSGNVFFYMWRLQLLNVACIFWYFLLFPQIYNVELQVDFFFFFLCVCVCVCLYLHC